MGTSAWLPRRLPHYAGERLEHVHSESELTRMRHSPSDPTQPSGPGGGSISGFDKYLLSIIHSSKYVSGTQGTPGSVLCTAVSCPGAPLCSGAPRLGWGDSSVSWLCWGEGVQGFMRKCVQRLSSMPGTLSPKQGQCHHLLLSLHHLPLHVARGCSGRKSAVYIYDCICKAVIYIWRYVEVGHTCT